MSGLKPTDVKIEDAAKPKPAVEVSPEGDTIVYSIDSTGRRIGAKQLDALDMFELTILLGENSGNNAALNQAMMVASIVSIDGEVLHRPISILELKARIKRVGFHGYTAVSAALSEANQSETGASVKDAIKN